MGTFAICVLTSATGATSLLTIPLMIQVGVEPRIAIATNMALLVPMNLGSSVGFRGEDFGTTSRLVRLVVLTTLGSSLGAFLLFQIPSAALRLVVPCAMIAVLAFLLAAPARPTSAGVPSYRRLQWGYAMVLLLGVYGGFFSGGYVTMLVTAFTYFFAYTFLQAISLARMMNLVSSLIAAGIFAWHGVIDWPLAGILGAVGFLGAFVGARLIRLLPEIWLRRAFVTAVALMAAKALLFDL